MDVIAPMKILVQMDSGSNLFYPPVPDTSGDKKVGLAESVYILNVISGTP
jgi:hypothetical protein